MDVPTIPPSASGQPWPRRSDGSHSRMLSKATVNVTNIESLPNEVLFDILLHLPADYLHDIARLVCSRWYHMIRSHDFINAQIQHSTYGLLLSSPSDSRPHSIYVTATQGGRIVTSELSYIRRATNFACCNGLALEIEHVNGDQPLSLHVINPATKQSFPLPSVFVHNGTVYRGRCGISYSAASMKYKVTLLYNVGRHQLAGLAILTVGVDKSWRHVEIPHLPERAAPFSYLFTLSSEGFLHWGRGRCCLTLNVETEIITVSEAPIPSQPYGYWYYLSTGRYLSLLVGHGDLSWEVWEMRPAESGEWRKALPDIDLEPQKCKLAIGSDKRLFPVGWVKYPEVLAFCFMGLEQTCIFYNLETHEVNTIELPDHPCRYYRAFVHRNSLVWLNQD